MPLVDGSPQSMLTLRFGRNGLKFVCAVLGVAEVRLEQTAAFYATAEVKIKFSPTCILILQRTICSDPTRNL